jgi:tetratricopeptide (TPR) repeat protein
MKSSDYRTQFRELLQDAHRAGQAKDYGAAERLYREYLMHNPHDPQVLFNMGVLIQQRANAPADRFAAADYYHRCIACVEVEMETKASAMNNMGILMAKVSHPDKALICFKLALTFDPLHVEARINYAESLRFECQFEEADKEFETLVKMDPNNPSAQMNRGMIALMLGDFPRGWAAYEHRFGVPSFPTPVFESVRPMWRGEDLSGKTLLITTEQGFGDSIQFIRYAREIKDRWPDCRVWYFGHSLLIPLFAGVDGLDAAFDYREAEDFDFHVPIMSIPYCMSTTLDTIPNQTPYISLDGLPMFQIPEIGARRIGLVWAGSPKHGKDEYRSVQPEAFQCLIDSNPDAQFYSLQVGPKADEVSRLRDVIDIAPRITGWTDTAQALSQLDLLISVDTATAHLAGALNVPTWVLIQHSPDFRWMLTREDSPWYPRHRLFRQETRGDWTTVIRRIETALCTRD